MNALARASRLCIPEEYFSTGVSANSRNPTCSRSWAARFLATRPGTSYRPAKRCRFSLPVSFQYMVRSPASTRPMSFRAWRGWASTFTPAIVACPEVGTSKVASILSKVVFPAPFGPRSPTSPPVGTVNETPLSASMRRMFPRRKKEGRSRRI
ncbi:MAG: hypothetical protein DDT25_01293 [Chloroflexi bacterium]|nr:hypothetical protein [Chloroflexota bacterium]